MDLLDRLCDTSARVVFFPVRHHSPACARLVGELIRDIRPAAVLIEGPSDFNADLDQLFLDHTFPIAIFTYTRREDGSRSGAYYPFCDYSPEWAALRAAREVGAERMFVDRPWADRPDDEAAEAAHRYADAELRRGRYVRHLCERFGVEDFDDLWDKLAEVDGGLSLDEYLRRAHEFCFHVRAWEERIRSSDRRREAFMAAHVAAALERHAGRIVVVTGGFHSSALAARLEGLDCLGIEDPPDEPAPDIAATPFEAAEPNEERGIAITPYSYERLDSLTGYDAGMPSPGFYDRVWRDRLGRHGTSAGFSHRPLLEDVVAALRARDQTVSTADLIAVETTAQTLASLRGRPIVWRRDLLDAVTAALVKEEYEYGCSSPFLEEVLRAFRGDVMGRLADDARLPPLVHDVRRQLEQHDLVPRSKPRDVEFDLLARRRGEPAIDLLRSRLLHRLRVLEVSGFRRTDGTDFVSRRDLTRLWESWQIRWTPEFDAGCVEACRYGTTLGDAARERLAELARGDERDPTRAAALLLDAALCGIDVLNVELEERVEALLRHEGDFVAITGTLGTLLHLYCFDEALGTAGAPQIGRLLREAFLRSAWLLEGLGNVDGGLPDVLDGIWSMQRTFERAEEWLGLGREDFVDVLRRIQHDGTQHAAVRGAAVGTLWTLDAAEAAEVRSVMAGFPDPESFGDFLAGLFRIAREVAQRHPELVASIDELLVGFSADEFTEAMPSLRLAFTYFTPREKHHMLVTLFESLGLRDAAPLTALEVDAETAAATMALEARVFETMETYGLMGGDE